MRLPLRAGDFEHDMIPALGLRLRHTVVEAVRPRQSLLCTADGVCTTHRSAGILSSESDKGAAVFFFETLAPPAGARNLNRGTRNRMDVLARGSRPISLPRRPWRGTDSECVHETLGLVVITAPTRARHLFYEHARRLADNTDPQGFIFQLALAPVAAL